MVTLTKEQALEHLGWLVDALRSKRALLVIDSKSHGSTAYFQIACIKENGLEYTFELLMNFLGFKKWMSRDVQQGNIAYCAGLFREFIWKDEIPSACRRAGFELPKDWDSLTDKVAAV